LSDVDDPFKPADATIVRPRPGAGRRSDAPVPRRPSPAPYADAIVPALREIHGPGLNPLVQAASPLLMLSGQLRSTLAAPELGGLRQYVLDEIRRFEQRAAAARLAPEVVKPASYALCASLDEAVLSTPWGAQSEWAQQPLLVALHHEAWGGEKVFDMIDRVSRDPARHLDLMELLYLCLAFGFAGKYRVKERGQAQLAELQRDLYRKIRDQRGAAPSELSLRWQGIQDRRHRLIRYVPWWVVASASLALLTAAFVGYSFSLADAAAPVKTALNQVGKEDFAATGPSVQVSGPTLKRLLAADEARGAVTVEESGGRTLITLVAPDLFASGSATINGRYEDALARVASALNQVPGRVLVEGHTDDQPLRSFRYRDNFELSRDRAANVARVLQKSMDPARIQLNGAGSANPRFLPVTDSENRARNRRVEIVHVRG
jgi:type VI secretion system protein ImpK